MNMDVEELQVNKKTMKFLKLRYYFISIIYMLYLNISKHNMKKTKTN